MRKIRFLRTVSVDVEKSRLDEVWDRTFNRWDELAVEDIFLIPGTAEASIKTEEGDLLMQVPSDSFTVLLEEKKPIIL